MSNTRKPFPRKMSRPPFRVPIALSELAWRLLEVEKENTYLKQRLEIIKDFIDREEFNKMLDENMNPKDAYAKINATK